MVQSEYKKNALHELGYKIFLDRYAQKDMTRSTLTVGDVVIVVVDSKTGQREIGKITALELPRVTIQLLDGEVVTRDVEHVDKPLETDPGQMMDRVAAGIAAVEATPELQKEWAERFRWLLDDWKFVPAGRILTAAGTEQELTFYNCMPPDQEILTAEGYKRIADVRVGELVVTHRNRLQPVLHKFERETEEEIFIIQPKKLGYDDLRVTGDHKVYAIRAGAVNKHRSRDGLRLSEGPDWIPARELRVGDYLAVAYNGEECPPETIFLQDYIDGYERQDGKLLKTIERREHGYLTKGGTHYAVSEALQIDAALCYLFGRWLGDGCVTHRTGTDIPSGIKIVFGLDEKAEAEEIAGIIESKFGISPALKLSSTERWYDLWVNSMPIGQFFKAFLGAYSYGKRIPEQLMHLPDTLALALLRGLFSADGYISGNKLGIVLSNRVLSTQVHQLLLRLGYFFSIRENTHRLGRVPAYRVQATANECGPLFQHFFDVEAPSHNTDLSYYIEYDGLRWIRINAIRVEDYSGVVMDIEVNEDHSFVSAGVVVSNCYVIPSPNDSRGGIIETLRQMTEIMSRGGGVGINVSSLRPRHAYVKGVNGRSSGAISWGALYSFVTGLIEQGGCFGPAERIATTVGLIPAKELADRIDNGEVFYAHTHQGPRKITARFRNGVKPLYTVTTGRGYQVQITEDHKVAVLMNGKVVTMALKYLQPGDEILLLLGQGVDGDYATLQPVQYERSIMSTTLNEQVSMPAQLDEDTAYLLGYMHGDGYVHVDKKVTWSAPKAIKMSAADAYPQIRARLVETIERVFGITPSIETGDGAVANICIYSRLIIEWLAQNHLLKGKSENIRVPEAIFRSPASVMGAFIAGYFDADGCNRGSKGGYGLDSVSRPMLADIQQLLALNGIVSRLSAQDRSEQGWRTIYRLSVTGRVFKERFAEFVPTAKLAEANGKREENTYPATLLQGLGVRAKYRQRIYDGVSDRLSYAQLGRINARLSEANEMAVVEEIDSLLRTIPDTIATIEPVGEAAVYDFEVDEVHLLSGNGIYTSNSRRGALMLILNDWHPDVFDFINSKRTAGQITNANISVGVSDKLMDAVKADGDWELVFPDTGYDDYDQVWAGDLEKWQADGRRVIHYRTVKARDLWNALIESAWASAEPGVWFSERTNNMSNSWYYSRHISTNPCGEQPLPGWGVCNLGAINLAKFYDEEAHDVDWDALEITARYATRFLDNVIDVTPYFFEENKEQQLGERRVGLNNMGLAELLVRLGIRYGSDESVVFIDKLYGFLARVIYETSIELAEEKGPFPQFVAEKFVQSGFMQSLPADIQQKVLKHGIRNVTLTTQAPTGCVSPDTLVSTATSLRPMIEMGDPEGQQWQIIPQEVHTDEGLRKASHFYINGYAPVKKLTTKRGFAITATHNHRLRVIDTEGHYAWRRMDEFEIGDKVVLKRNTMGEGEPVELVSVEQGNRALSKLPRQMTPELAELLGLYMGDGYTKRRGGLHIVVAKQDPDLLDYVQNLMRAVWGGDRQVSVEDRQGCWVVNLIGYYIPRFFDANGLLKPSGNHGEGAEGAFIPSKVLQGGRACVSAFLRGLFEADGSVHRGTITLVSTSQKLISQVQIALLGLGIVATVRVMPEQADTFGSRAKYELRILNRREGEKFAGEIGFISQRKQERVTNLGNIADRGDSVAVPVLCKDFYLQSKGLKNEVRQRIIGLVSNGALTQQFVRETVATYPMLADSRLAQLVAMDVYLDEVASIEEGFSNTYDISVPDNQTYIANGFVSHNTTGTMVNTSTGIEPFFSWVYYRKSRLGLHEEQVPLVQEWYEQNPGATELPDYFVTAMELTPEEHVKVQAAIQRWVDSSISKTCNVPNNYTVEQVSELYQYMYELGCKGGTIYRDGSRDEQVLMLKGDERAESEIKKKPEKEVEQVSTPHKVYPRPKTLSGVTISRKTPFGTAYITMNSDENGCPFEVFITVGKAGSDLQADAEGLGRMLSLQLRTTAPQNRMQMLKLIIEQLQGIGGARSVGMGPQRVSSLPDVVAAALMEHYFPPTDVQQLNLPINAEVESKPRQTQPEGNGHTTGFKTGADMCPQCGTISLIRVEGCRKCEACGYSEC